MKFGFSSYDLASPWRKISFLSVFMLLTACTQVSLKKDPFQQQNNLALPASWLINGRVSISQEEENWYAKFSWLQDSNNFQLRFTGPLGETQLLLTKIGDNILLKTLSGETRGNNLEQLLHQQTQWNLPISSLLYWIQAKTNPQFKAQVLPDSYPIEMIQQLGWTIKYPKYVLVKNTAEEEFLLPKKVFATKKQVKIKLIVSNWQLDNIDTKSLNPKDE